MQKLLLILAALLASCWRVGGFASHVSRLKRSVLARATPSDEEVWSLNGLRDDLTASAKGAAKLDLQPTFDAFANNKEFISTIWQKKPYIFDGSLDNIADSFTINDVKEATDKDFLEAGRGTFQKGNSGWNMAAVSTPRGTSFEDAKLRFEDIQVALKQTSGTVVFNSAGGFIPKLAGVCLNAINAFQFPAALNAYLTNPGQETSAPPHTDKQDVFVLQSTGQKRWRVYAPPPPSRMIRADPYARGKGKDILELTELAEPIIDTVLQPGQILYIPGGYPHTTDTLNGISDKINPSVHMTVGVDTHIWNLNYASLRRVVYKQLLRVDDKVMLTKLDDDKYWALHSALPLGFLSSEIIKSERGYANGMRGLLIDHIKTDVVRLMKTIEGHKFDDQGPIAASNSELDTVISKILMLHEGITDIFGKMYADVHYKITPTKMDLSFFRSQPYFKELESAMENFEKWVSAPSRPVGGAEPARKSAGFSKK